MIGSGSDTFFDIHTLTTPDGDFTSIVTTGYFSNQLKLYWTSDPSGQWTNSLMVAYIINIIIMLIMGEGGVVVPSC